MYSDDFEIKFVESEVELKLLLSDIKKDNLNNLEGCVLPQKLKPTDFVICIRNKITEDIYSFIWFGIYADDIHFNINLKNKNYLHINYSYTFKKHRNNGLNKKLRLWIETYCVKNSIGYIISVPLPDSNSKYILEKLGYFKINTFYMKNINFK